MGDFDKQLKEVRALRGSLTWTLSQDGTRVRYNYEAQHQPSSISPSSKKKRRNMAMRRLDFPIIAKESEFVRVDSKKFKQLPVMVYKMAKLLVSTYDLLGLLHLIQVPVDHTFRPPLYETLPLYSPPNINIVEPAFVTGK